MTAKSKKVARISTTSPSPRLMPLPSEGLPSPVVALAESAKKNFARRAPAAPPANCATVYAKKSGTRIRREIIIAKETAGLKCAPEVLPKAVIIAVTMMPLARAMPMELR
jgi:hypothetical protein